MDEFIIRFIEMFPNKWRSISPNYPMKSKDKIDYIIQAFRLYPPLLNMPTDNGNFDMNAIGYRMDEIFEFRNQFVHGQPTLVDTRRGHFNISYRKFKGGKTDGGRKYIATQIYEFSIEQIEGMIESSINMGIMLSNAVSILNGKDIVKEVNEIIKNHAQLKDYPELGLSRTVRKLI